MALLETIDVRKIALAAVVGILAGGLSGFAYSRITTVTEPPESFASLSEYVQAHPLQVGCQGGASPVVALTWSLPDTVTVNKLFRSAGSGIPAQIFDAGALDPTASSYEDTNVTSGGTYTYFFETDERVTSNLAFVTVTAERCALP